MIFRDHLERFLQALETDTESRHERFGDSLYVREPELKLGRGGLRDFDVIQWCVRARYEVETLEQSIEHGLFTQAEVADLRVAQDHLWTVRNRLHLMANRRHDRVTYEDQEAMAAALGYRDGMTLAVEQYMQTHYRHARTIARLVDCIPDRVRRSLRPPPTTIRDLGGGVLVHDRRVTFKRMDLDDNPSVAFRLYNSVMREKLPPDPEARDVISAWAADRDWSKRLRRQDEAATVFSAALTRAEVANVRRGSLLRELHEVGLLLAMVPELEAVTGRIRHDAYHAYTVDAQSIMAVDRLHELARGELASEYRVVSRLAAEMPRPLPLYLALLLHGIGTGHPDDPPKHAAAIAGPVGDRLGLAPADVQHMQWLIANQATMYFWATRRDITDPRVIAEVGARGADRAPAARLVPVHVLPGLDREPGGDDGVERAHARRAVAGGLGSPRGPRRRRAGAARARAARGAGRASTSSSSASGSSRSSRTRRSATCSRTASSRFAFTPASSKAARACWRLRRPIRASVRHARGADRMRRPARLARGPDRRARRRALQRRLGAALHARARGHAGRGVRHLSGLASEHGFGRADATRARSPAYQHRRGARR